MGYADIRDLHDRGRTGQQKPLPAVARLTQQKTHLLWQSCQQDHFVRHFAELIKGIPCRHLKEG